MADIEIAVSDSPEIPGLRFRHFRGEDDYESMLAVLIASESADGIQRSDTLESLSANYRRLSNCDPFKDMIFAIIGDEMIGYARGWWSDDTAEIRLYHIVGFLIPEQRRQGIGNAMQGWMETHLRGISAAHPSELSKYYQAEASQVQQGAMKMLSRAGYTPVRYFYEMVRPTLEDIPDLPLPEGLELRPVRPEHYRAIWASVDETSVDEWGYSPSTQEDYLAWLDGNHFQPDLWQIAWDKQSGRVAGTVLTYIDQEENAAQGRKRGYTEGIGVIEEWRRQGVASALIARSLETQKAAGMSESSLIVDGENSEATRLYERCGFKVVKWNAILRKPLTEE